MKVELKELFNCIVDGILPASTIVVVEKVIENMFTVVKATGETLTLKLCDALGGEVFDLQWHLESSHDESGTTFLKVWNAFPQSVQDSIASFLNSTLPGGHLVSFIPSPELLLNGKVLKELVDSVKSGASFVVDHTGKTVCFAGKVFQIDGFFTTILLGLMLKTLFRSIFDSAPSSWMTIAQDIGTAVCSGAAVYATKFVIVSTILHPPVAVVWGISAVAGYGCNRCIKSILSKDGSVCDSIIKGHR